ncbi:MAG: outer membrane beta-barrel protein [Methyloglobulus sp.]|nr:porin family protein [Methyloglobulus sp.]
MLSLKSHVLILSGLLVSATAIAEEHKFYVQFNAGAAFAPSDSQSFGPFNGCVVTPSGFGCGSNLTETVKQPYDAGFAGSVALGYRIADQLRIEVEGIYQSNNMNKVNVSFSGVEFGNVPSFSSPFKGERERTAFLLNGYYDFKNSTAFTPYITAGMGGYHMRLKGERSSVENDLDFAWQAGAGVNYKLDDRISFDLKYRYFGGADAELQSPNGFSNRLYEVGDHQVMAGIRVGF